MPIESPSRLLAEMRGREGYEPWSRLSHLTRSMKQLLSRSVRSSFAKFEVVPSCVTFETLLNRHQVKRIDF